MGHITLHNDLLFIWSSNVPGCPEFLLIKSSNHGQVAIKEGYLGSQLSGRRVIIAMCGTNNPMTVQQIGSS